MGDDGELLEEWANAPRDPPAVSDEEVIATEHEGVVHLRVRARVPRASGSGSLAPSRAWVSAPSTAWRAAEPEGAAIRE